MEKAILDLEDGEGETVGYDSAKYVRFMVSRGPHEGVDEIKKMEALQRKVEKAAEAAELEEKSGDGQTEEEKASAVKRRALIEAISEKLGGKSFEKLAKNVVSKMASKTGNLDFSPEDALLESALRKLRAGAEPGDEMVILLTNASGYEMADAISLFQEERKALDEAQEAQTELARKAKARIPVEGKRSGKKGKPTGKKEKGNKKGR